MVLFKKNIWQYSRKALSSQCMNESTDSGYIVDSFEGISRTFTDVETIHESEVNIVAKAKRYGRWWLLKSLRPELAQQENFRQRLRKEFELMAQLQHTSIVTVVGLETVEGLGECIVMEYVEGHDLMFILSKGDSPIHQRQRMAEELMEAVEHIHAKGIVHRDLKPSNIMVTDNGGHIKLVDFGLADSESYAMLKQPAGTPKYMSPEQKKNSKADVRNDIFSLGIILGQMNLGNIYRKVVKKCLLPAGRRYSNVAELRNDILRYRRRRKRIQNLCMAAPIMLLMVGIGWLTWQWHVQRQTMQKQQAILESQIEEIDSQRSKIVQLEQVAMVAQNEQALQRNTVSKLTDSIAVLTFDNIRLQEKEKAEAQRKKLLEEAKEKGYAVVDEAMWQYGMLSKANAILDDNIGTVQNNSILEKAKNKYRQTLIGKFNEQEIVEIMMALDQHQKDLAHTKWKSLKR